MTAPAPRYRVALCGNPNTGKTTLFNVLTGAHARVGNYPGVTVERYSGRLRGHPDVEVIDVPGTYSVIARSADEAIAIDLIAGLGNEPRPDLLVVCVDATQLVRSLYLLLQAQELGANCVVALTMVDETGRAAPDVAQLSRALGAPVFPVVGRTGQGVDTLRAGIDNALRAPTPAPPWRWTPSPALAGRIAGVRAAFPPSWPPSDALALWAVQCVGDDELTSIPPAVRAAVATAGSGPSDDDEAILGRYRWLDGHIAALGAPSPKRTATDRIDRILLHRVGGLAVFAAIMFVLFMSLFEWSAPAIDLIDHAFTWLGVQARTLLPAGVLADFVVDGLIAGVGSVLVFLPQILLLFLFLGLLEDLGYLARVAYLMDRIMRSMNLHGRAFIPMLSGFACAVPAIMATRTMERQRDRILTMLVIPLMTCSARLPVYTLIIAALLPANTIGGVATQSLIMVGMYAFSVATSLASAWLLSRTLPPLRARRLPFVIELPPYRAPRISDVTRMMWSKSSAFLREAGTVILGCTVVLWALLYFPRQPAERAAAESAAARVEAAVAAAETGSPIPDATAVPDPASAAENQAAQRQLENSYGARLGKAIEPAIEPLGFDWKIGVGIIGAFAAREVFVATMGVIYGAGDDEASLRERLRDERRPDGARAYSPLTGLSLMVFFALACQCMSTLAVVKRETGGYRWPLFLFGYMTVLAYGASLAVFQVGTLLGF